MSDSSSSSPKKDPAPPQSSSTSSSSSASSAPPPMTLHSAIKSAVDVTNSILSTAEHASDDASSAVLSRVRSVGHQARHVAAKAAAAYDQRRSYGPVIVGGSAAVVGGLVALRRGKIPGMLVGLGAGTGAYAAVYGVPVPVYPPTSVKKD